LAEVCAADKAVAAASAVQTMAFILAPPSNAIGLLLRENTGRSRASVPSFLAQIGGVVKATPTGKQAPPGAPLFSARAQ